MNAPIFKAISRNSSKTTIAFSAVVAQVLGAVMMFSTVAVATPTQAEAGQTRCKQGFVWRGATSNDFTCVRPASRARAQRDNAQALARIQPGGGAYGQFTCKQGYVWREATGRSDKVCVRPAVRSKTKRENQLAQSRVVQTAKVRVRRPRDTERVRVQRANDGSTVQRVRVRPARTGNVCNRRIAASRLPAHCRGNARVRTREDRATRTTVRTRPASRNTVRRPAPRAGDATVRVRSAAERRRNNRSRNTRRGTRIVKVCHRIGLIGPKVCKTVRR